MSFADSFKKHIFSINEENFESCCLDVYNYQYHSCDVYKQYCNYLGKNPTNINSLTDIPFLPIEFFKFHTIKSGTWVEEKIFKSSGTTQIGRSHHYIRDLSFYHQNTKIIFESFYGPLTEYRLLALLPSYQEQGDSSLISMTDSFLKVTRKGSDYYLDKSNQLANELRKDKSKKMLIGVSYALLELAEQHHLPLTNAIVMETGGMKGRRKEITRMELHEQLKNSFKVRTIHSEYGMTELMSQAYGKNGIFQFPKWAKTIVRDINDPFSYLPDSKTGGLNIIDLANVDSCSFIETKDLGRALENKFEVLGRFDNSDIRGCNLMF